MASQLQIFSWAICCSCCSLECWTLLLEPLADSPFAVFRVSLGGFWRGASASVHRRVVVSSVAIVMGFTVQTVAQTGDSMVQFWMVVDMHVAVQMTGLWFRQCITAVFRSCGALSRLSMSFAVHRQGVAVPVILQGPEIPWCSFGWSSTCPLVCKRQVVDVCCCSSSTSCGRPCDRSSTVWWIFQLPRRDWPHSAFCAEDRRFAGAVLDGRRHARWCASDRWSMSLLLQFIDKLWTSL